MVVKVYIITNILYFVQLFCLKKIIKNIFLLNWKWLIFIVKFDLIEAIKYLF